MKRYTQIRPHNKKSATTKAQIDKVVKEYSDAYAALYSRRPNYHYFEESSGIIAIYVDHKIKVAAGNVRRIRELTKQLTEKLRNERNA